MAKSTGSKIRKEIDDTLGALLDDDNLLSDVMDIDSDLPAVRPVRNTNYGEIKSKAELKAKQTISALMKFYLTEDVINQDEYVKASSKIHEMTLSSLLFQLETAERALVILLETIDGGELAPRMFEVLGTLQKSMLDIIKSQTMYLMAAEEGTKKLSRDLEVYKGLKKPSQQNQVQENGNLTRGTKALMQGIQDEIKEERKEDTIPTVEFKDMKIEPKPLTNESIGYMEDDIDDEEDSGEIINPIEED